MTRRRRLDSARARELGRLGGLAKAAMRRTQHAPPAPFAGTILDAMDAAGLDGPSWAAWRTFWRCVFALPLSDVELAVYRRHTARTVPPAAPVREAWQIVGRRGGKSRNAALAALYLAVRRDYTALLAPGERGVIAVIAADRKQAGQVLGYLKGVARMPTFAPFVARMLKESVEFRTGVAVEVHTCSYRTVRGYSVVALVADELAFWAADDDGANPDSEVLTALRPGMLNLPGTLLLALSSPYAQRGELHRAHAQHFGQDDPRVLVWNADTRSMNPGADAQVIAEAFELHAVSAASEYGQDGHVSFRHDVEGFLDPDAVRAVTVPGRRELPPRRRAETADLTGRERGASYVAFCDPSGGSQDSMALAIAHAEQDVAVLDLVREVRAPFSPNDVVQQFAETLKGYRLRDLTGDAYSGEWVREAFRRAGIEYAVSERNKSAIYRELLPLVNGRRVQLLDLPRLRAQLVALERRTARGGRDSVDHPPGGRDDVSNATAGALVLATGRQGPRRVAFEFTL